jgi:pyruvate/2-oxoglutarate/acetoin dehydrogenase E1 component
MDPQSFARELRRLKAALADFGLSAGMAVAAVRPMIETMA